MTTQVQECIQGLRIGEPFSFDRLTVVPLRRDKGSTFDYLTIQDAVERKLADVEEVSEGGSVPQMAVRNRAGLPVLIPDGTALVGTKQNRVVNLSILLAAGSDTVIPVSCVERGRWSRASRTSSPSGHSDKKLRLRMCRDAYSSLKRDGQVRVSQSGVWCHVQEMLGTAGVSSPSDAYQAIQERRKGLLEGFRKHFVCPAGTCGVVALVDGKVDSVDVFDKPETFEKIWPTLLEALAIGAAYGGEPDGNEVDPMAFLEKGGRAEEDRFAPVGVGTNVGLKGDDLLGAALVKDDTVLHLSLFATPR